MKTFSNIVKYSCLTLCGLFLPLVHAVELYEEQKSDVPFLTVTGGVRTWMSTWTSWSTANAFGGDGQTYQVVVPVSSKQTLAITPLLNLRHQDFFAGMSYMANAKYALSGALNSNTVPDVSRKELDLNAGYYLMPTVALTIGYKSLQQDYGQGADLKWAGPTAGVNMAASLGRGLLAYGTLGFGSLTLTVPTAVADANGKKSFDSTYTVTELGLAYPVVLGGNWLKSLTLTGGYRTQTVVTGAFGLKGPSGTAYGKQNLKDITQGFTLGLSGSY